LSSVLQIVASTAFGVTGGVLAGFIGIGGGTVLPPLLVFVLGFDQHRAQGISLAALVPPVGLPAVLAYRRSGVHVDVTLVTALVAGFASGAFGGAWLAHRLSSPALRWLFAGFLVVSALRAAARAPEPASPGSIPAGDEAEVSRPRPQEGVRDRVVLGVPIGAIAGVMSGLLGVGGAIVALPLLRSVGRLGRLEAQATTLAMMLPPIGLPAVYVYAKEQGGLPWELLIAVAVGFAGGAGVGGLFAGRVNARLATAIYAAFLVIMAAVLVIR
jgi:uncharacterized membrane protein YfcA